MFISLPNLLRTFKNVLGIDRTWFTNQYRHNYFETEFRRDRGRFELSRENALEICFLASLHRVGFKSAEAAPEVRKWIRDERVGKLLPLWAANPTLPKYSADGFGTAFSKRNVGLRDFKMNKTSHCDHPVTCVVFINRAEIVGKIDALFKKAVSK